MKDEAESLELPNDQNPRPHAPIYYGQTRVPHPKNTEAMKVNPNAIMSAVNKAK